MKKVWIKSFHAVLLLLFQTVTFSQNPTYQLQVESGGYMDFKIYSLNRYEGGISYDNWTRLKIIFTDTTSGTTTDKWYLDFKANTTDFLGSSSNIPLDYVSIEISDACGGCLTSTADLAAGKQQLTDAYVNLINNGDEGTFRLNITYHLDSVLLNRPPDYYSTELIFKLDTVP